MIFSLSVISNAEYIDNKQGFINHPQKCNDQIFLNNFKTTALLLLLEIKYKLKVRSYKTTCTRKEYLTFSESGKSSIVSSKLAMKLGC